MPDPATPLNDPDRPPAMPGWVKLFALIAGVVILLAVAMVVFGGGMDSHGPWRHMSSPIGDATSVRSKDVLVSSVTRPSAWSTLTTLADA